MKKPYITLVITMLMTMLISGLNADDWSNRSVSELVGLAYSKNDWDRISAVMALSKIYDERASNYFSGPLYYIGWNIQEKPTAGLYREVAKTVLLDKLNDTDWRVRRDSAGGLGSCGDLSAIDTLVTRLRAEVDIEDRQIAEKQQILFVGDGSTSLRWVQGQVCRAISDILKRSEQKHVDEIKNKLVMIMLDSFEKQRVRALVSLSLGEVGDSRSVASLINMLQHDTNPFNRAYSARLLGSLGDKSAIPALTSALKDQYETPQKHNHIVQYDAAWALKELAK